MIQAQGIAAQEPAHSGHEIGIRSFEHQMKMIPHQAIGMDLKAGFQACFCERFQKVLPVDVVMKDVFPTISPAHDVIDRSGIFDADLPWHEPRLLFANREAKWKMF